MFSESTHRQSAARPATSQQPTIVIPASDEPALQARLVHAGLHARDVQGQFGEQMADTEGAMADSASLTALPLLSRKRKSAESAEPQAEQSAKRARTDTCAAMARDGHRPSADVAPSNADVEAKGSPAASPQQEDPTDPTVQMREAARNGDIARIRELKRLGADPNKLSKNRHSVLGVAAASGQVEAVRELIAMDADVNSTGSVGTAPLILAANYMHPEVIMHLLAAAANVNFTDLRWWTPLLAATRQRGSARTDKGGADESRRLECMRILLDHGADPNRLDMEWNSALHHCCARADDVDAVSLLLDRGADINAANARFQSPLRLACLNNRPRVVKVLLERGARIDTSRDSVRDLPLARLAASGESRTLSLGLNPAGDQRVRIVMRPEDWQSSAHVKRILAWLQARDVGDESLLELALKVNSTSIVHDLLEHGADPHRSNRDGITAIQQAAERNQRLPADLMRHEALLFQH